MTPDQWEAKVRGLRAQLEPLRALTVSQALTLLRVAEKQGLTVDDYAKRAAISPTTMSRHLLDLGERTRTMKPGLGLVEGRVNVTNQRERIYELTVKGSHLITDCLAKGGKPL